MYLNNKFHTVQILNHVFHTLTASATSSSSTSSGDSTGAGAGGHDISRTEAALRDLRELCGYVSLSLSLSLMICLAS